MIYLILFFSYNEFFDTVSAYFQREMFTMIPLYMKKFEKVSALTLSISRNIIFSKSLVQFFFCEIF